MSGRSVVWCIIFVRRNLLLLVIIW